MEEQSLSAPAFEWTPVDRARNEIRILELAQGNGRELLSGQLCHAFLDLPEKSYYEAMRYVWGAPTRDISIVVDNALVAIPASADSALRCMRLPNESRRLWIDCICIDQNNELERGHQVGIMSEIFTFSQVEAFEGLGQDLYLRYLAWNDLDWYSARKFIDLPYFRRLWIVQEVARALRTTLHCGNTQLDCGTFVMSSTVMHAWLISRLQYKIANQVSGQVALSNERTVEQLLDSCSVLSSFITLVSRASKRPEERTITQVLRRSRVLESTDPRDQVFGFLGLLKYSDLADPLPLSLTPDYKKSLVEVYRDAIKAAIRQHHDLGVFLYSFERPPEEQFTGLPSWVPLWYSIEASYSYIVDFNTGKSFLQHSCDEDTDPSILTLAGFTLGKLKAHCQPSRTNFDDTSLFNAQNYEAYFGVAAALTRQWAPPDESTDDRLGRTLMGVYTSDVIATKRANADSIASFSTGNWRVAGQLAHSLGQSPSQNERLSISIPYVFAFLRIRGKRFFVTDSGQIGLGPLSLEEGDVLAVLGGGKCPFVLCRAEERGCGFYTMVGPAYVDGIMDGEAVQEHMEQGREIETIHLI